MMESGEIRVRLAGLSDAGREAARLLERIADYRDPLSQNNRQEMRSVAKDLWDGLAALRVVREASGK